MKRPSTVINEHFQRSPSLQTASLVVVILMIAGCALGVVNAFSLPTERQEQVTKVSYKQKSVFSYTAELTDTILYDDNILTDEHSSPLFLDIVERIDGSFTHILTSDQPLEQLSHRVEVIAKLEHPENWSKTVVLVPETVETDRFRLSFPIDVDYLFELIDTVEEQIGITANAYNLTIQANIHTTAVTEHGPLEESLTPRIAGTLQRTRLVWSDEYPFSQTRQTSLRDTHTIPIDLGTTRTGWIIALGFAELLGILLAVSYIRFRPLPLSAPDAEAQRAMKNYGDRIANVEDLPIVMATEMVTKVSSLDDLMHIAGSLLKPVLHKAEPGKHTYQVVDGFTTYEYVSQEQPAPEEDES